MEGRKSEPRPPAEAFIPRSQGQHRARVLYSLATWLITLNDHELTPPGPQARVSRCFSLLGCLTPQVFVISVLMGWLPSAELMASCGVTLAVGPPPSCHLLLLNLKIS